MKTRPVYTARASSGGRLTQAGRQTVCVKRIAAERFISPKYNGLLYRKSEAEMLELSDAR
jgi:hypothetical protein